MIALEPIKLVTRYAADDKLLIDSLHASLAAKIEDNFATPRSVGEIGEENGSVDSSVFLTDFTIKVALL